MLSLDTPAVLKAVIGLAHLESAIEDFRYKDELRKTDPVARRSANKVKKYLDEIISGFSGMNVRATTLAADELRIRLSAHKLTITYQRLSNWIQDIRITLRRELSTLNILYVENAKESYYTIQFATFGSNFETSFSSALYEVDEAGKCHALGRSSACVFHLMKVLEIGIEAIAKALGIPGPVNVGDRNWGNILETIRNELNHRCAAEPPRWNNNDKNLFSEIYDSLDAVRAAWRNPTMHVEIKYTDDEVEHIFVAMRSLMKKLSGRIDEKGQPPA